MKSILHCHTMDSYGARFPVIPQFSCGHTDTSILWILSGMIDLIKELWERTDKCEMVVTKWHGWLLTFLTKKCFPSITIKADTISPIKSKFVTTTKKLMEKLDVEVGDVLDLDVLGNFFQTLRMLRWYLTVFY